VLLADIDMPGNQHLELLANMPPAAAVPTILLTGRPAVETAARSVEYRVAAYLLKPPEFEELCRVLRSAAQEGRDLRRLRDSRTRLQHWEQELAHLQRLLAQPSAEARTTAMRSYLRVTLRNLVVSLVELENLLDLRRR
jgi:DNA-binding NtrC family response regulator